MRHLSRYVPLLAMIVFAAWCLYAIRNDLAQLSLSALARSWDLIAVALLLSLVNYAIRILRWRAYLARLGHRLGLRFTALSYCAGFAYTLSPGKLGEMVRARYYLPLGVPLATVTAGFFTERLMDLLAMVALAALVFTTSSRYESVIILAAAILVLALGALAFMPWARIALALKSTQRLSSWLRSALGGLAAALASTRSLLSPGVLVAGFAAGLLAWGAEGVGLKVLSCMFPTSGPATASAVGIYGIAVLVGGLSFLPGGLGSTEAVMTALLTTSGYPVSEALLITLTCRLVTLWFAVLLGWVAVLGLRRKVVLAVAS